MFALGNLPAVYHNEGDTWYPNDYVLVQGWAEYSNGQPIRILGGGGSVFYEVPAGEAVCFIVEPGADMTIISADEATPTRFNFIQHRIHAATIPYLAAMKNSFFPLRVPGD